MAGQVAGGPGSGCFQDSAAGCPALFAPDMVFVLALVGGIGLGISTSASLGMNGSLDC